MIHQTARDQGTCMYLYLILVGLGFANTLSNAFIVYTLFDPNAALTNGLSAVWGAI
jgi:hypothetical protein